MPDLSGGGPLGAIVQVLLALIVSGSAIKMMTIRQDRRKIAGDASAQEASAASTLSGAALKMVEASQKATQDAEGRTLDANNNADEARRENDRLWRELNRARWEINWMHTQEQVYLATLRAAGIEVRPVARPDFPEFPPPDPPGGAGSGPSTTTGGGVLGLSPDI